ncbi:DUF1833 family protein [Pseudomonas aeruginosa]
MTEDGRLLTFIAGAIDVSIPKRDNSGNQNVGFAIDNVTGFAQQYIAEAIDAGEPVTLVLRIYLGSDLTAPAERPYRMRVKDAGLRKPHCPGRSRLLRPHQHRRAAPHLQRQRVLRTQILALIPCRTDTSPPSIPRAGGHCRAWTAGA